MVLEDDPFFPFLSRFGIVFRVFCSCYNFPGCSRCRTLNIRKKNRSVPWENPENGHSVMHCLGLECPSSWLPGLGWECDRWWYRWTNVVGKLPPFCRALSIHWLSHRDLAGAFFWISLVEIWDLKFRISLCEIPGRRIPSKICWFYHARRHCRLLYIPWHILSNLNFP